MTLPLSHAASPYLRQHADQPVSWRPWGPEAFAEARARDLPLIVSIGYATCHWCHVMSDESFSSPEVAEVMNRYFINIKVDREQHPGVDAVYMDALLASRGSGGWPLHAFIDHQGRPFFTGVYFPKETWIRLCLELSQLWRDDRPRIFEAAAQLSHAAQSAPAFPQTPFPAHWSDLSNQAARAAFDEAHPGFGTAPKFPPSPWLIATFEHGIDTLAHAEQILEAMQDGGIHDRIGGGFHRYTTDAAWQHPHYEKMLYDQAQLTIAYALGFRRTGRPDFRATALASYATILHDFRVDGPNGDFLGYASAFDADDPAGEGAFYQWLPTSLTETLGPLGARLAEAWLPPETTDTPAPLHPRQHDLTALAHAQGYPDAQALRASWEPHLRPLRYARMRRPAPARDDKVLTDLNGLCLSAFAAVANLLGEEGATDALRDLITILRPRHTPQGLERLPGEPAYITDYGLLSLGLVDAYHHLSDPSLITWATSLIDEALARFRPQDQSSATLYATPATPSPLPWRPKETHDGPYPSGQNALALAAIRIFYLTGETRLFTFAQETLDALGSRFPHQPLANPTALRLADAFFQPPPTLVITGDGPQTAALLCEARAYPGPLTLTRTHGHPDTWPLQRGHRDAPPAAHLCHQGACLPPIDTPEALRRALTKGKNAPLAS